jgi:hypothetical protein
VFKRFLLCFLLILMIGTSAQAQTEVNPWVILGFSDGDLYVFSVSGERRLLLEPDASREEQFGEAKWLPDGEHIVLYSIYKSQENGFRSSDKFQRQLRLISLNGGLPRILLTSGTLIDFDIQPDGLVGYVIQVIRPYNSSQFDLWTLDPFVPDETQTRIHTFGAWSACGGAPFSPASTVYWREVGWHGRSTLAIAAPRAVIYSTDFCVGESLAIFDRTSGKTIDFYFTVGMATVSPDHSFAVWVHFGPSTNNAHSLDNGKRVQIDLFDLNTMQFRSNYAQTPLDIWLVALGNDGTVIYSTRGITAQFPKSVEQQAAYSNATARIYGIDSVELSKISLRRIDAQTGRDTELYRSQGSYIGPMALSPDGQTLYFTEIPSMRQPIETYLAEVSDDPEGAYARLMKSMEPILYQLDVQTGNTRMITKGISRMEVYFPPAS